MEIRKELRLVESIRRAIISTSSNKSAQAYSKWRLDQFDRLEENNSEPDNIFSLFRKAKHKTKKTVFSILKN